MKYLFLAACLFFALSSVSEARQYRAAVNGRQVVVHTRLAPVIVHKILPPYGLHKHVWAGHVK